MIEHIANAGIVRLKCMPIFMDRIGEKLHQHCEMHTFGLPPSHILFQHVNSVSSHQDVLKDVELQFANKLEKTSSVSRI